MGIFTIAPRHLRFAIKLCAVVLALFVGFHFQLETPRWAVLTAAIVAAGPAFAAGGEPYSGAIRYRGMLRIAGTFIGCIAALAIIILMIRAPLLMMLVCCLWAGFCTWISSLVRRKLLCLGAGGLYRADYYYHHPYRSDAGAAVCR
jgi:p-hydroxybenzoic acid efflux pump subunit AaeB